MEQLIPFEVSLRESELAGAIKFCGDMMHVSLQHLDNRRAVFWQDEKFRMRSMLPPSVPGITEN